MSPKSSVFVILSCFLLLLFSSAATAFNITRLFESFPEFSTFGALLNQTGLSKDINSRQTITVLAVDNGAIGGISGRSLDIVKRILSVHVILDYYDVPKLQRMNKKSNVVTTLYQSSGTADNQQGFVNISTLPNHQIAFASAIKGSPLDVHLVKLLASQPYNISVLHVSGVIFTPGIDGNLLTPPPSGAPKKSPAPAPAPAKKKVPVVPAPSPDDGDSSDTVAPETSPPAETPVSSPPVSGEAPAADAAAADKTAPTPAKSSAVRFASSFFAGVVVVFVSSLAAL